MIDLSVVIVNWNTAHLLSDCLQSVFDETNCASTEVIVVDNGSTDGSVELLSDQFPTVTVLSQPENLGYQAACNIGSRAATGALLLHINSDARLTTGSLKAMIDVLRENPQIGVIAPRLVYGDGSFQRWTAGQLPTLTAVAHSFLLGDRMAGRGVWIGHDRMDAGVVGWVSSACLIVRAETFASIGGLDEQFFAYMDDVDLCQRAAEQGWLTWYEPGALAIHFMGGSQDRTVGVSATAITSMIQWFKVRKGRVQGGAAAALMATGFMLRAGAHSIVRRDRQTGRAHYRSARVALLAGLSKP